MDVSVDTLTTGPLGDVAVRLAIEGVPVQAIARAIKFPSEDVRIALEEARDFGKIIELPASDWPVGQSRSTRWPCLSAHP